MSDVDAAAIGRWFTAASAGINGAVERLTELDRLRGDADHGFNISNGFAAGAEAANAGHPTPAKALLAAGAAVAAKAAGTSGALWGAALGRVADDIGNAEQVSWEQLSVGLVGAAEEIAEIGGAREGDNTMLDVLGPSGRALRDRLAAGEPVAEAVAAVGTLASELAEASADTAAKRGRASYVGERAIGSPDPGCVSAAIVVAALSAAV